MNKSKPDLYFHSKTGEIVTAHPLQAAMLPKEYKKARFTKNLKGERVMRVELNNATVDIVEQKEVIDVDPNSK